MKKKKPTTEARKAYAKGYNAALKRTRHRNRTLIEALNRQINEWRHRYFELRRAANFEPILASTTPPESEVHHE